MLLNSLKISLRILLVSLAMAPGLGGAMNIFEFEKIEQQAIAYAIEKDYKASFRIIQEFVENAEAARLPHIADKGYNFLRKRELIANEALAIVNYVNITADACKIGAPESLAKAEDHLNSKFAHLADPEIQKQKTDLIIAIRDLIKDSGVDACTQLTPYALAEEKKTLNEAAIAAREKKEMAETHARDAKARLKQMGLSDFCELYGDFVRKKDDSHLNYSDSQISEEFLRRKITIDQSMIKRRSIRIGSSECQIYASYGKPDHVNRTVSKYGVHEQLVFKQSSSRSIYLYIKNGRLTSFQDGDCVAPQKFAGKIYKIHWNCHKHQ